MEFLNSCVFENNILLGLLLCSYDPTEFSSRVQLGVFTPSDITSPNSKLNPRGFRVDENGVLFSDTTPRYQTGRETLVYMQSECEKYKIREKDITDFVLSIGEKGLVLPTYVPGEEPDFNTVVKLTNFKVSNSSFNIYSSYKDGEGFKTVSLLNPYEDKIKPFYIAIKNDADITDYVGYLKEVGGYKDYNIYYAEIPLLGWPFAVGEAFLNYLAYSIAVCNIGVDVLKQIIRTLPGTVKAPSVTTAREYTQRKKPYGNVSIVHSYKNSCLDDVLGIINDSSKFLEYLKERPEAQITVNVLQSI